MNGLKLSVYINNFVHLNPKKNKYPNFNKYDLNSFLIIQNQFKENKKYIITSNYDYIFYNKNDFLNGKKWIEILLSSKDIFEYHKKIRDDFPFCKQKKLTKTLLDDLFFWFDKNINKIIIDSSEVNFGVELKNKLEKIRYLLDKQDWSIYFFELQKLIHEQIIKFLLWENKPLKFNNYSNLLFRKMILDLTQERANKYLNFVQKVNLYRNVLSKASAINQNSKNNWNKMNNFSKQSLSKELYYELLEFIDVINLLLNQKKNIIKITS